jgi:hypothetical protein
MKKLVEFSLASVLCLFGTASLADQGAQGDCDADQSGAQQGDQGGAQQGGQDDCDADQGGADQGGADQGDQGDQGDADQGGHDDADQGGQDGNQDDADQGDQGDADQGDQGDQDDADQCSDQSGLQGDCDADQDQGNGNGFQCTILQKYDRFTLVGQHRLATRVKTIRACVAAGYARRDCRLSVSCVAR